MPNDAIIYYRQSLSLNNLLSGGRIDKIVMPSANIIELFIRSRGANHCLLLSAEPSKSRIHLTESPLPALPVAPAFLMHLRKHIGNGKIISIKNIKYERIVIIKILKTDELLDTTEKQLIIEVIGKYSNIILVNPDGKISESIRHIPLDATGKRQILPGLKYVLPEAQNKLYISDSDKLFDILNKCDTNDLYGYVMKNLAGFSPVCIKEAIYRVFGTIEYHGKLSEANIKKLIDELINLYEEPISPYVYLDKDLALDFSASLFKSLPEDRKSFDSLDEAMDFYYKNHNGNSEDENPEKSKLFTEIHRAVNKATKRLANFRAKEIENKDYEKMRLIGELITANIYRIPGDTDEIILDNYYDGSKMKIVLDKQKTPQQNAQAYYKKYAKMKKTSEMSALQSAKTEEEINALLQLELNLSLCSTPSEIEESFTEAEKLGLTTKKHKNTKKNLPSEPIKLLIDDYTVFIGKNSSQNERLTKSAKPNDIWLHASKIPGSHVIIKSKGGTIPNSVIEIAARHCAYFSSARSSDKVPVDYTFKSFVSKPSDAPLGKVIYTNQKTIYVSPLKPDMI